MTDFNDFVVAADAPSGTVKVPGVVDGSTATKAFDVTLAAQALLDDASIAAMASTLGAFATATSSGGSAVPLDFGNKTSLLLTLTGNVTSFALPTNAPTGTSRITDLKLVCLASGGTRTIATAAFALFDPGAVPPAAGWSIASTATLTFDLQRLHEGTNEIWKAFLLVPGNAVQPASETIAGVVELATTTEATTGTDTTHAVTAAGVTARLASIPAAIGFSSTVTADGTYPIGLVPVSMQGTSVDARTVSGTCSIVIRKNGTAINGFGSAVAITSTTNNTVATESFAANDYLDLVISSASSLTGLALNINTTRSI